MMISHELLNWFSSSYLQRNNNNDAVLHGIFIQGLNNQLKNELAMHDKPASLHELIDHAIQIDNRKPKPCPCHLIPKNSSWWCGQCSPGISWFQRAIQKALCMSASTSPAIWLCDFSYLLSRVFYSISCLLNLFWPKERICWVILQNL